MNDSEMAEFIDSLSLSASRHSKSLQNIEDRLGLTAGFVQGLMEEPDDWAFIIKTSVIVESALGQLISESLLGDALDRHIRALPMDGRMGKIQLAQDLSLIGPKSASRIRAICEVRNDFAHGLKVLKLSVADYFGQMTEAEFYTLVQRFFASDRSEPSQNKVERPKREEGTDGQDRRDGRIGKYLFWTCACVALLELSEQQRKIDADRNWRSALVKLGHAFLARQQGDESNARRHIREALDTLEAAAGSRKEADGDST